MQFFRSFQIEFILYDAKDIFESINDNTSNQCEKNKQKKNKQINRQTRRYTDRHKDIDIQKTL